MGKAQVVEHPGFNKGVVDWHPLHLHCITSWRDVQVEKLQNELTVSVVSPSGEELEKRELHNIALPELFPGEPVCIIDWFSTGKQPTVLDLTTPVLADGCEFNGSFGWGSSVKRGQTLGFTRDLLAQTGLLKNAERAIMAGRMLLGQGLFGGLKGRARVLVVRAGTIINGNLVHDGHSLVGRSWAENGYNGLSKIVLGSGKQSYSFWQRIPWSSELQAELLPFINRALLDVSEGKLWQYAKGPHIEERRKLVDIDEVMDLHPYVANAFTRNASDIFTRIATTVHVPTSVRVAVPTTAPKAALWGRFALTRYPVDSNGSTQAVSVRASKAERDRIDNLEVIQYTISAHNLMTKGCFGVVDDELMPEGVDVVLCQDDIKMGSVALGKREVDGVIAFNQWFGKGSAIGINPEWAKDLQGLDFDGDIEFVMDLGELPVLYRTIKGRVQGETPKLVKTKSPLYERAQMAVDSMANLVGFASNVASTTFVVADRETLARRLGFASEQEMDERLNWFIKVGTDGFKTKIDLKDVETQLSRLQSNLGLFVSGCPWTKWPNEWAFTRQIPHFAEKGEDKDPNGMVIPSYYDGTIAQILRLTLPSLQAALENPIDMLPLSHFRGWAHRVPEDVSKACHELQMEFNARVHSINFSWSEDVTHFKEWWQKRVRGWAEDLGIPVEMACDALWHEAHSARSREASGASVFIAFPERVKEIIAEKPGLNVKVMETLLLGLQYVFKDVPEKLLIRAEVREFEQDVQDKRLIRKILAGEVEGKHAPREPYPEDLIGMFEIHAPQPELGLCIAEITKAGRGKAWHCRLTRV